MNRQAVVEEARSWLRTPYHHLARVKGHGVDCAQILIAVYSEVGLVPKLDVGYYTQDWAMHRNDEKYLGWIEKYAKPVVVPKPGDIALFRFGRCISHAAIVVEWPLVIHSYVRLGVVYSNAEQDQELRGRVAGFWSLFEENT